MTTEKVFLSILLIFQMLIVGYAQHSSVPKNNSSPYIFEDINNDGYVDIITAEYTPGSLFIYINNVNGFNSPIFIDVPVYLNGTNQDLSFADFDGNGYKDILVSNRYGQTCGYNSVRIYWNSGSGAYFSSSNYKNFTLTNPYCSEGFGVNGNNDSLRDVFVTTMGFSGNSIPQMAWQNAGGQIFISKSTVSLLRDMYGPIEADFNNDGNSDLMFIRGNWTGGPAGYHTLFGNGNHSYTAPHIEFSTTSMQTLGAIELKPLISSKDYAIIKTNTQNSNQFIIAEWTGSSFQHVYKSFPSNISFFKVLDANQDGYEDILGVLDSANQEHLIPYYNDGTGNLTRGNSLYSIGSSKSIIRAQFIGNNLIVLTETSDSLFVDVTSTSNCTIPVTTTSETACSSYTSPSGNYSWTTSGTYHDTLQSVGGCDSVLQINLSFVNPSFLTYADTGVNFYLWQLNNRILTVSGIYYDTLTNSNACDSIVQLNLSIISKSNINLIVTDSVICSGENSSISIATDQIQLDSSFTIKVNSENPGVTGTDQFKLSGALGNYKVMIIDSATGAQQMIDSLTNDQIMTFDNGPGVYYLKISPLNSNPLHKFQFFGSSTDKLKLVEVLQWGNIKWTTMDNMFNGCENLIVTTIDIPNLSQVNNMQYMFFNCKKLNGPMNIGAWDVSGVATMEGMFRGASVFNQSLNNWNTSSLTNTRRMFQNAILFNQPLHNWDVSNVTNMYGMFYYAESFNQNIENWNVQNVLYMSWLFGYAKSFNQPLSSWDVSSVTSMYAMFYYAESFNQPIGNWDVSSVTDMTFMFPYCFDFNQNIGNWNMSSVTSIAGMFYYASSFNQPIGSWNTGNVLNMSGVFTYAFSFNHDISSWNTGNSTNMYQMFYYATSFNQDIGQWDVSNVTDMKEMFTGTSAFNQDLSNWCVANINTQPQDFSTGSSLLINNHPVWGTCPAQTPQYPAGTVHCDPNNPTAVVDVTNPITGKTWMDRNLGASRVAHSSTDALAYGDLYQWGRGADGHQCRNSSTTTTLSSSDQPGHGDFIIAPNNPYDWRNPQNINLWQGVNGINNPCPNGYRIPTLNEFTLEVQSYPSQNLNGAFNSTLKFTAVGYRYNVNGALGSVDIYGDYWTNTISGLPRRVKIDNNNISPGLTGSYATGMAIRCIKN